MSAFLHRSLQVFLYFGFQKNKLKITAKHERKSKIKKYTVYSNEKIRLSAKNIAYFPFFPPLSISTIDFSSPQLI